MELLPHHPFRSPQAQAEYLTHYDRIAAGWPIASETRLVDTSFGQTFVRIGGPRGAEPLVLLPGSVLSSLMWIPNIAALSQPYRTVAVDNIYHSGRSIYTRPLKTVVDFAQWLDELFTALELGDHIRLMGLSYGAWLTCQYALHHPERLAKIVLLANPAIVGMQAGFIGRFMLAFVSPRFYQDFMFWLMADATRPGAAHQPLMADLIADMQLAGRCFTPKAMVLPKVLTDQELKRLTVPALFVFGEHEKTFPPQKALQRLNTVAPQLQTALIAQAGHDLTFAQAERVTNCVLEFLK